MAPTAPATTTRAIGRSPDGRAPLTLDPALPEPRTSPATPAASVAATTASRHRAPLTLVLIAASLPMFMATLDNLVMTSALPAIQRAMGATIADLQWFLNAYTLAFATLMLAAATVGDRLGRRSTFLGGVAVFALASVGSAVASSPAQLIAARALQGAGAAAILPLSLALVAGAVPRERRPLAIGVWGGVSGLGVALGPLVGGAVVEGLSWQAIFWLNVPVAVVAVPLVLRALPESARVRSPLDVPGLLLVAGAVFAAVWGIIHATDDGWTAPRVLGPLVAAVVLLGLFVARQARASHPLVPLRLFRSRSFSVANVAGLAFSLGMFGAVFLLVQYLQVVDGYSPLEAGVRTLPWTAAPMVVAPIAGALVPRLGVRALLGTGLGLQAVALAWLALALRAEADVADMLAPFVLAGVGMGLTFAPSSTAVLADMAERDHATASSVNATIREVGVALGIAILTAVFLAAGGSLTAEGFVAGAPAAIAVGAAVVALGAVTTRWLPTRTR